MVSQLRHHDVLDALAAEICRLRIDLVDREREAGELLGGDAGANDASNLVAATRMTLEATKDRYFDASEAARKNRCAIHGARPTSHCADCAASGVGMLHPVMVRLGPDFATDRPRVEIDTAEGHALSFVLDVAHRRSFAARLDEIGSGRIMARPPSRRVLEIALFSEEECADTMPPLAVGEGR